ncbi:hypothetical protein MC885_006056, partial [Smutsia gigantea]
MGGGRFSGPRLRRAAGELCGDPCRVRGARRSLAQGWGRRRRECAARVSVRARAPAREVLDLGGWATGALLPRCGGAEVGTRWRARSLIRRRARPRGSGPGAPLRSSFFPGLLRLRPRALAGRRGRLLRPGSATGRILRPYLACLPRCAAIWGLKFSPSCKNFMYVLLPLAVFGRLIDILPSLHVQNIGQNQLQ